MTEKVDSTGAVVGLGEKEESLKAAGVLVHDFNNILTIIATYCDLAMKEAVTRPIEGYLGQIRAATLRAEKLTERLLEVCGVKSGLDCPPEKNWERHTGRARGGEGARARAGRGESVLVVEDERWLRKSVALVLGRNGYNVIEASNADEALEVFEKGEGDFDLLFVDMVLNGSSGVELAKRLREMNPGIRVLLTSGFMKADCFGREELTNGFEYLQKPYEPAELLAAIGDAFEGRSD